MRFIAICNWAEYQHYKERNPPWIKLHRKMMTSRTWVMLDDASRVLAVSLMMLAAATDNKIPHDLDYLKKVCFLNSEPNLELLLETQFIEIIGVDEPAINPLADASKPLAQRQRREETEESREEEITVLVQPVDEVEKTIQQVWNYYVRILERASTYTFTHKRKAKAIARYQDCLKLARGDPDEAARLMKLAVDALASSQFHRDGGYIDWDDNLFKSTEQLQKWLDKKQVKANGKSEQRASEIEDAGREAEGLLGIRESGDEGLSLDSGPATVGIRRECLPEGERHPRILDGGIRVVPRTEGKPISADSRPVDRLGEKPIPS